MLDNVSVTKVRQSRSVERARSPNIAKFWDDVAALGFTGGNDGLSIERAFKAFENGSKLTHAGLRQRAPNGRFLPIPQTVERTPDGFS